VGRQQLIRVNIIRRVVDAGIRTLVAFSGMGFGSKHPLEGAPACLLIGGMYVLSPALALLFPFFFFLRPYFDKLVHDLIADRVWLKDIACFDSPQDWLGSPPLLWRKRFVSLRSQ
jgi:hypothetical protein